MGSIRFPCTKTLQEEETLLNYAQQRVNTSEGKEEKIRMAGLCPFAKWLLFLEVHGRQMKNLRVALNYLSEHTALSFCS